MTHKREHYVVECHYDKDVFHMDYGKDESCALRAAGRMLPHLSWDGLREIRIWYNDKVKFVWTPKD